MRTTYVTIGAIAVLALLAACGDGADPGLADVASLDSAAAPDDTTDGTSVDAPEDPEEAMLAYTECMREHGVDMPDPQTDGEGRTMIAIEDDLDGGEFEEAQTACEPLMENVVGSIERDPEREAEMKEQMLAFAACMREHGVDMPDPTFGADGRIEMNAETGPRMDDDDVEAANEACAGDGMFMSAAPGGAAATGGD